MNKRETLQATYRVAPADLSLGTWCVVPVNDGPDAPAPTIGFDTRDAADKECARLNELWATWEPGEAGRADAVLGRMMGRLA